MTSPLNLPAPGRCQAIFFVFKLCIALCFVKQLPGPILCAPPCSGDPLSRSYGVNLPSSLTMILSSALVYSTRPPVSVYGTGQRKIRLAGFLGSWITITIRSAEASRYCPVSSYSVYLTAPYITTRFNVLFRQHADVSLLRRRITLAPGAGMLTGCPSDTPCGFSLGPDLT